MCKFHSSISDGKGKVLFFQPSDIVEIMSEGNPKSIDFNSHSEIGAYYNINGIMYDRWNKWEYDPKTKVLTQDTLCVFDDAIQVKKILDAFFKNKDLSYLQNMYNMNSGNRNSGYMNSGNGNSGTVLGSYCTDKIYYLFNKPCTKEEHDKQYNILMSWFTLNEWIPESKMKPKEKKEYHNYKFLGGYLKTIDYKKAWKKCPEDVLEQIKELPNFDKKVFKEISGL